MTETDELTKICPFCGGYVQRFEISSAGGSIVESMCCDIPMEFIDNYDVFSALPEILQQVAIERKKAEHNALRQQWLENARNHRAALAAWYDKNEHLYQKGDRRWL
jgi:hypothetical protein